MKKSSQIVYGTRAVLEALNADQSIEKVLIQRDLGSTLTQELKALLAKKNVSHSYVPSEKLHKVAGKNHQGVVAFIAPIRFQQFDSFIESVLEQNPSPLFLLLDQLTDVRNFGAIIRTAECCGVDGIIIPRNGAAPITEDTVKTSAGAVFNVPISKVDHLKDAIYYLQSSGVKVIAASEKGEQSIFNTQLDVPIALVMGSEGKGISASVLKSVDEIAKLPLLGKIASLNVSVACAVFLYEAVRQRLS